MIEWITMYLSLKEAARSLNIHESTLERWARQGRIPAVNRGGVIVFDSIAIEKWAKAHHMNCCLPTSEDQCALLPSPLSLMSAMRLGGMVYEIPGNDVTSVIREALKKRSLFDDPTLHSLSSALLARESLASTGVGNGIAIPHLRQPIGILNNQSLILTAFLNHPVDFHAVDRLPVFVLFILLSPSVCDHLFLLSRLSFCIRDRFFTDFLKTHPQPEALLERVGQLEEALVSAGG